MEKIGTHSEKKWELDSEINIMVSSFAMKLLKKDIEVLSVYNEEYSDINSSNGVLVSPNIRDNRLPEGNLTSLNGIIVALHDYDCSDYPVQANGDRYLPKFLRGNGIICIHVLVEDYTARIICDLSKHVLPVGIGRNTPATFHRILVLSEQNKFMMVSVTFITVNYSSLAVEECHNESKCTLGSEKMMNPAFSNSVPVSLLSELQQISGNQPVKFYCRVVAVYVLVLEKHRSGRSVSSVARIPLASFVLEDGSSTCCCWFDSETAAGLLGLDGLMGGSHFIIAGQMKRILQEHDRVVIKNYRPIPDSSFIDLTFCVGSNKPIDVSDEYLLKSLIATTCVSKFLTVEGCVMDAVSSRQVEERLAVVDMSLLPMRNVWATSICRSNILAEARSIVRQLS